MVHEIKDIRMLEKKIAKYKALTVKTAKAQRKDYK